MEQEEGELTESKVAKSLNLLLDPSAFDVNVNGYLSA